jgi:hypothetical protein
MYPECLLPRYIRQFVRMRTIVQFPESVTQPTKQPYRIGRYFKSTPSKHVIVQVWATLHRNMSMCF